MSDISTLLDKGRFGLVGSFEEKEIPASPGLYAIRIKDINKLPEEYKNELKKRNDNLLYIGKAKESLRKRLWRQELHAHGRATFFRAIGALIGTMRGFSPLTVNDAEAPANYDPDYYVFSDKNNEKIISWINDNLLINWCGCDNIEQVETELIQKHKPLFNSKDNPQPFQPLKALRGKFRNIAGGYDC